MGFPLIPLAIGAIAGGAAGYFGGKTKTKVDPYGSLNPEQIQVNKALGPYFQNQLTQDGTYTGQLNEPITGGEQDIVGSANRLAAMSEGSYADLLNPDPNAFNKNFEEWYANPTTSLFRRNEQPSIEEALPTFSTARNVAIQKAYQDTQDKINQTRYAGWQAAQDRRLQALGQAPAALGQYAQIAAIPRVIKQAGLDSVYNDWLAGQTRKQNSVDQMLNFLGISTVTRETTYPYKDIANTITGGMQGASWGASLGSGLGLGSSSSGPAVTQSAYEQAVRNNGMTNEQLSAIMRGRY